MEANILTPDPYPLTLGLGSKGQNSTFLEHGHVAYQMKGNPKMQQYGSKYFVRRPSYLTSEVGVIKLRMQKRGSKNFACRPLPTPTPRTWSCCISNYTRLPNAPMLCMWLNIKNNCSMKKIKIRGMSCNSLWIPAFVL